MKLIKNSQNSFILIKNKLRVFNKMTLFDPFKDKLASEYIDIMCHSKTKQAHLESLISAEAIPSEIREMSHSGNRIGYILRACCPFTKAEIELAQQAVQTLKLDKLVFIIWPFRYINGFDSALLDAQQAKTAVPVWEERMEILRHGLEYVKDDKLQILEASKDWYIQSEKMSDANDSMNPFWTGTWFVIRKLQYFLNQLSEEKKEFFYCCGEDQFNPNIYQLVRQGQEKIWKDYSILQQLAIHHVFVVPQNEKSLQKFEVPNWSSHKVFFGTKLKNSSTPAQNRGLKTINMVNVGCVGGVASYLVQRGFLKKG